MASIFRQNLNQVLGTSVVILLCIAAVRAIQVPQLNRLTNKTNTVSLADLQREIKSEKLQLMTMGKLPSFGFSNLVADWTFLNFLQYFGAEADRAKTDYALSPEYFEVILKHDPYFLDAYRFLSSSTTLYAGMPERTIALMNQGLKYLSPKLPSQSYYIWRYKGTDELLFLGNPQAAKQSFKIAAQWANTYSDVESKNVAAISQRTAQFIEKNPLSKSAQISAWTMVLNNAFDNRARKLAIHHIQALGGKVLMTPGGELKVELPKKD
ncbi:hypothetical protein [Scytonema millei]|uniref:Uncharacterized protein n=1 Tax=Scytonema millei VB511283 TaxID=1245923 RepID=A0A9X5I4T5_9CYAN|nr:hypothetical protein [Scytonema millei]NHC34802.1 hypothetical protein [Scytonema millei VB511283]